MLPVAHPAVIFRSLSEGAVLFSTSDEVYFGLNTVGARVWELLPPALNTVDELCATLAREYPDAAPEVIRTDVEELLGELEQFGLVVYREPEPVNAQAATNGAAQAPRPQTRRVG